MRWQRASVGSALGSVFAVCAFSGPCFADEPATVTTINVIGSTPLPGVGLSKDQIAAPVQTGNSDADRAQQFDRSSGIPATLSRQRLRQRDPGQPVPARRQLPRLHRVAAARHAAGAVGLHGRRAPQPALRRRRQLGPDSAGGHLDHSLDARVEPAVRAQHARRRAVDPDQGRLHQPGHVGAGLLRVVRARSAEFETGGSKDTGLNWYVTGNYFHEDGWRDDFAVARGPAVRQSWVAGQHAPACRSRVRYADTDLTGNGLQEQRLLAQDYSSVYTMPDTTKNQASFLNLLGQHDLSDSLAFSGNAYYRDIRTSTLERRHQRRFARPSRLPAQRGRAGRAARPRATPAFRRAAKTPPTRRFPSGAASPTGCSTPSRTKSATAC